MELLYVNVIKDDKQLDEEVFCFIANYLISEKVTIHSNVGYALKMFKNINNLSDDEILINFEFYIQMINGNKKYNLSDEYKKLDDLKALMKTYKQLKQKNQLPPNHIKHLQILKSSYLYYKKMLKGFMNDYMVFFGIIKYFDLYDEKIIKANFSEINRDGEINDNELGELIYNNMSARENLLLLDDLSILKKFKTLKNIEQKFKVLFSDYFSLYEIPLVTIPCSSTLQLNELIVLRQQFLPNFTEVFTKVQFFRTEINKIDSKKAITKKIKEFKTEINDELQKLQYEIDNNLYFLKIKNSDSDYTNVTINIGILPNLSIFNYFSSKNLITANKYEELEYRLGENVIKKFYDLFVYYKIDLDINKYKTKE